MLIAGSASNDGGRYDYRELIGEIIGLGAHIHLYGQFRILQATGQLHNTGTVEAAYRELSDERFHIHPPISPDRLVEEWSCYDAGLLHVPQINDKFLALNMPNHYNAYGRCRAAGSPARGTDAGDAAAPRITECCGRLCLSCRYVGVPS